MLDDSNNTPTEFKELYRMLYNLKDGTGDFTCGGSLPELCFPGLYDANIGHISLPLQDEQAHKIKQIAKKATVDLESPKDTTSLKIWQLDANQVTIKNDKFKAGVQNLFAVVKENLGLRYNEEHVEFRFHKMLLYEKGFHCKIYDGAERDKDMFASIQIQLPSVFEGGKITVCHAGNEKVIEMDGEESTYCCKYVALYSDCEYQVSEIMSGYRLSLNYTLHWTATTDAPSADTEATVARNVANILPNICSEQTLYFSWLLSNEYKESDFSGNGINALTGFDATVAKALQQANEQLSEDEQYEFHVTEIERTVDQHLEYNNGVPSYRNGEYDIDVGSTFHNFDATEKHINFVYFCFWDDVINSECPSDISLTDFESELWGKGSCDDSMSETYPDYVRYNTYNRYAIFAWPKANFVEILGRRNHEAAIEWVFDKFNEVQNISYLDPAFQKAEQFLRKLLDLAISENIPEVISSVFSFLISNLKSESLRLANMLITEIMTKERDYWSLGECKRERYCLDDSIIQPLVKLVVDLGWPSLSEAVKKLFDLSPVSQHGRWAEFLMKFLKEMKNDERFVEEDVCFRSILTCLVEKFGTDAQTNQLEDTEIYQTTENTRVEKIAILLFHIGDQELLQKFTDGVCDYIRHSESSCILQELVESLMSRELGDNQFWIQLLKCRIEQLEKCEKMKVKPFSWEQEEAIIDGHPSVQAFLRGLTRTMRYDIFTSEDEARNFMFKYFKRPWPATDVKVDPREYSVWVSIRGRGTKTYAVIKKTREWYDRKVAKFNQNLDELKELRTFFKSAINNTSS